MSLRPAPSEFPWLAQNGKIVRWTENGGGSGRRGDSRPPRASRHHVGTLPCTLGT
jgi:hypothetical protein